MAYLGGFSSLPRVFWCGWEALDHRVEFTPLWMQDVAKHSATAQVTSAMHFHYAISGKAVIEFRKFCYTLEPGQGFLQNLKTLDHSVSNYLTTLSQNT